MKLLSPVASVCLCLLSVSLATAADANKDGKLTWPKLKAYRAKVGDKK